MERYVQQHLYCYMLRRFMYLFFHHEGTTAGITACVQAQNGAPNASAGAKQLSDELLEFQRENLQSLERFL